LKKPKANDFHKAVPPARRAEREDIMTLEEKRIERLYELMHKIERTDPDMAAVLKWAIFELERKSA
jgi:hypothetical protein